MFVERGYIFAARHDFARTELAQLIEQEHRIGAHLDGIGGKLETHAPSGRVDCGRVAFLLRSGFGRLLFAIGPATIGDQCAQFVQDRGASGGMFARLQRQQLDMVLGVKRDADQLFTDRGQALANAIERGLELMDEIGHLVETEHAARSLERVQRAECAVDQIAVAVVLRKVEQRLFERLEQVARFLAEGICGIGAHAPTTLRMMASI